MMPGFSIRRMLPFALAVCLMASCGDPAAPPDPVKPPVDIENEPVLKVEIPGAYGVPGGSQILQHSWQGSVLLYGDSFSYRLLDPVSLTVVSLSGLPVGIEAGKNVDFQYRLSRRGISLASESYSGVQVLQVKDGKAWLKKDEETFFVIQLL